MHAVKLSLGLGFGTLGLFVTTAQIILYIMRRKSQQKDAEREREARRRRRSHHHRARETGSPIMGTFARSAPSPHSYVELYRMATVQADSTTSILDIRPQCETKSVKEEEEEEDIWMPAKEEDIGMVV